VLSGYVIAFVVDGREKTLRDFVMRRITRVWSVAIPALVLGAVLAPLVGASSPSAAAPPATSVWDIAFRSIMNLFFVGQVWTLDIEPPLNGPFWSLNYEVWYYALFAAWTYLQGWPRILGVILLGLACGLKILLLLPCWLAGVWLYRHRPAISPRAAAAVFLGTIVAYLGVFQFDLPARARDYMTALWPGLMDDLAGSNTFLGDYLVAALVAANFVGGCESSGLWRVAFGGSSPGRGACGLCVLDLSLSCTAAGVSARRSIAVERMDCRDAGHRNRPDRAGRGT
jgi:peptidoglycan/LPS O-acetylase OafA/YrhL